MYIPITLTSAFSENIKKFIKKRDTAAVSTYTRHRPTQVKSLYMSAAEVLL